MQPGLLGAPGVDAEQAAAAHLVDGRLVEDLDLAARSPRPISSATSPIRVAVRCVAGRVAEVAGEVRSPGRGSRRGGRPPGRRRGARRRRRWSAPRRCASLGMSRKTPVAVAREQDALDDGLTGRRGSRAPARSGPRRAARAGPRRGRRLRRRRGSAASRRSPARPTPVSMIVGPSTRGRTRVSRRAPDPGGPVALEPVGAVGEGREPTIVAPPGPSTRHGTASAVAMTGSGRTARARRGSCPALPTLRRPRGMPTRSDRGAEDGAVGWRVDAGDGPLVTAIAWSAVVTRRHRRVKPPVRWRRRVEGRRVATTRPAGLPVIVRRLAGRDGAVTVRRASGSGQSVDDPPRTPDRRRRVTVVTGPDVALASESRGAVMR